MARCPEIAWKPYNILRHAVIAQTTLYKESRPIGRKVRQATSYPSYGRGLEGSLYRPKETIRSPFKSTATHSKVSIGHRGLWSRVAGSMQSAGSGGSLQRKRMNQNMHFIAYARQRTKSFCARVNFCQNNFLSVALVWIFNKTRK